MNKEIGYAKKIRNYLVELEGLPSARVNDLLENENGDVAIVRSLSENHVEALMLTEGSPQPEESFFMKEEGISLPLEEEIFGRVIDPLGNPMDGAGKLNTENASTLKFDVIALGIEYREEITEPLETGISVTDALVPIGKGQRELVFGEPRSGKTTFLIDTIKNQPEDVIPIYTAIGKTESEIREIVGVLEQTGALEKTLVVAATSKHGAPMISIAPDTAFAIADNFRKQGKDVLLILDDLGIHAKYLREISLLSQTLPGREAYPGDIFYQHAHLLERAGNFNEKAGDGSVTLLPVIEADIENFSNLIPTNLMASTDGHLLFTQALRSEGYFPAVNVEDSVTRVGRKTQNKIIREIADKVRPILVEYEELKNYGIFGTEISQSTQKRLRKGEILRELLRQEPHQKVSIKTQILTLSLAFSAFMANKDLNFVKKNKEKLVELMQSKEFQKILGKNTDTFEKVVKALDKKKNKLEQSTEY